MKPNTKIIITAILTLGFLETIALFKGIDGALFSLVLVAIAGLAGYEIRNLKGNSTQ